MKENELSNEVLNLTRFQDLAKELGITTQTVRNWCDKLGIVPVEVDKVSHALAVDKEQLLTLKRFKEEEEELKRKALVKKTVDSLNHAAKELTVVEAVTNEMNEDDLDMLVFAAYQRKKKLREEEKAKIKLLEEENTGLKVDKGILEKEKVQLEEKLDFTANELCELRILHDTDMQYYTVCKYVEKNKLFQGLSDVVKLKQEQILGRQLSALSREMGIEIKFAESTGTKYSEVHSYNIRVFAEYFKKLHAQTKPQKDLF